MLCAAATADSSVIAKSLPRLWSASATADSLARMPAVAITLGGFLANEPIAWTLLIGGTPGMAAL